MLLADASILSPSCCWLFIIPFLNEMKWTNIKVMSIEVLVEGCCWRERNLTAFGSK